MQYIKEHQHRGIALVATLAILTVLAILASAFIIQMRIESKMAETLVLKSKQICSCLPRQNMPKRKYTMIQL